MSRTGKNPIEIPDKTQVIVTDGNISVKGPLGELARVLHPAVNVTVDGSTVTVKPSDDSHKAYTLWGTFASHIRNMIAGVNEAFEKKLVVEGIGYRAETSGNTLTLNVGYSHPVVLSIPDGIAVKVEKNEITISGSDKEAVGEFAATTRATRKPEPYKGKGIRYADEVVRRKQGKRAVT